MSQSEALTGAEWLARALAANGTTHVFFIDAVLRRTLIELGTLGVTRVLAHAEKSAVYMADGYARIAGRPGICFAQSVGAANMAAGLQDAYLGRSPVIALTGHKQPAHQHRNAYQEISHAPLFAPVTKFDAQVDSAVDLPRLLRQAWRAAMTGTPRPAHLDLNGLQAEIIETGIVHEAVVRSGTATAHAAVSADAGGRRDRARGRGAARRRTHRNRCGGAGRPHRKPARNCWRWGRRWRRRSVPRSVRAASSRRAIRCRSAASATMRHRPPTRSCTRPIWCCSSAATPATR